MSLTIKTFLSNYLLKPWEVEDPKKRKLAWAASIILGCASAWTLHAGCALVKYAIIPLADKTGLTAKIDNLKERYFPDNPSSEDRGTSLSYDFQAKTLTPEQEKQLREGAGSQGIGTKGHKGKRTGDAPTPTINTTSKEEPKVEEERPIPKDWGKAEANLRTSSHREELYVAFLLDNPKFNETAVAIANQFLEDQNPILKEKFQVFHKNWEALLKDKEIFSEKISRPDGEDTYALAALFIILKKNLTEESFTAFQNTKDQKFDNFEESKEFFLCMHMRGALEAVRYYETHDVL